jgi:hypothetical protein
MFKTNVLNSVLNNFLLNKEHVLNILSKFSQIQAEETRIGKM